MVLSFRIRLLNNNFLHLVSIKIEIWASLVAQLVKNQASMQGTLI